MTDLLDVPGTTVDDWQRVWKKDAEKLLSDAVAAGRVPTQTVTGSGAAGGRRRGGKEDVLRGEPHISPRHFS